MGRYFSPVARFAPWPLAAAGAGAWAIGAPSIAAALLGLAASWSLLATWRLGRALDRARHRIRLLAAAGDGATLESGLTALEAQVASVDHRRAPLHPLSGLPLREALLDRLAADGDGMLAVVAFPDFERLTAFDPAMGERVFAQLAARMQRMVPDARLLAQVDRGRVGIWFGAIEADRARRELDAIVYALGGAVQDGDRAILPQVQDRLARFDPRDGLSPPAFLARTLASFAYAEEIGAAGGGTPHDAALDRYALEQDLRQAVARRELAVVFQPLVDAAHGRVCGAEALLRWHHPDRGPVSPAVFMPVAEALGLAGEVGAWVLNGAVREAAGWAAAGMGALRVAVNVSGHQLERDDLPMLVARTLERHRLPPAGLEIELTESVATDDVEHCNRIFAQLRAMGVRLAVDDFGTGYSGFRSLRTLAFDKIKIDREFVTDVDRRADSQAICQSIVALARGLGIQLLAEGVERHEEYEWLRRHGCTHFQGYYFARPLDPAGFAAFVRDRDALAALLSPGGDIRGPEMRMTA